jgi:serine/threonine-protein kinase HipA
MTVADVRLWGNSIGAVAVDGPGRVASFEYTDAFVRSGIAVSPITMPPRRGVFRFPSLDIGSFHGLPGMLADALPDRFGNAVIDAWLATQGRLPSDINAVERLCYTGARGMGALEFWPSKGPRAEHSTAIQVDALVALASEVMAGRESLTTTFGDPEKAQAVREILRVEASAGGARAKAVIAWNPDTNEVRSGQVSAPPGFEYWLLKFDGVTGNADKELTDPKGYGAIEYAYSLMARAAGISMSECRLFEEGGRRHFMTRRFDRGPNGEKRHLQSLAALGHYDFNMAGAHSYEQAFMMIRTLDMSMDSLVEQYRRMVFNVVARNQDDHVKNIGFLMDKSGVWTLSPAYDVTYSYNPNGAWTSSHQMSLNNKRDGFSLGDLVAVAKYASLKRGLAEEIVEEVTTAVSQWPVFATAAGVEQGRIESVANVHRLRLLTS